MKKKMISIGISGTLVVNSTGIYLYCVFQEKKYSSPNCQYRPKILAGRSEQPNITISKKIDAGEFEKCYQYIYRQRVSYRESI